MDFFATGALNLFVRFMLFAGIPLLISFFFPSCKVCTNAKCKGDH